MTLANTKPTRHCKRSEAIQPIDSRDSVASRNDENINLDQDRLAQAIKFSNELSESRLREMAEAYRKRWTPARRIEKSQNIQKIKPWRNATGPKSGTRAKGAGLKRQAFKSTLRQHGWFLQSLQNKYGYGEGANALGITSTAALFLLMAVDGAPLWAFPRVTERNNE